MRTECVPIRQGQRERESERERGNRQRTAQETGDVLLGAVTQTGDFTEVLKTIHLSVGSFP